jgi:hypothetical protein
MRKLAFALAFLAVLGLVNPSVYAKKTDTPKCEKGFHYSKKKEKCVYTKCKKGFHHSKKSAKCVRNKNAAVPAEPAKAAAEAPAAPQQ